MTHRSIRLDDKYVLEEGAAFMTGIQALVRLPLDRKRLDRAQGLETAGFISGYRGSPLGGYDQQLKQAARFLDAADIHVWEGLNEDLAATAVWGSQQAQAFEGRRYDGVFGLWYGKAPGVDRSGDAFKHANFAGVDPRGGVLVVAGDDPTCKSSTLPSQSEFALVDAEIPVLAPATIQDVLDYGQLGWEMSRHSGLWVGMIATADTMDSAAVVNVGLSRLAITRPPVPEADQRGLGLRRHDVSMEKERRLRELKIPAALAFARANGIDRVLASPARPRLGIVCVGQAARDVLEALAVMGLSLKDAQALGFGVLKVGMPWPLEPSVASAFCAGAETVLVVEHKRALVEPQLRNLLYALPDGQRPVIEGKTTREGHPLFSSSGVIEVADVVAALSDRLPEGAHTARARDYLARIGRTETAALASPPPNTRSPHFCSGCPHTTSTRLPEGSRAMAGIGCHYMAVFTPELRTEMAAQMGGEGVNWIGQAPFTSERHVFANLGDGTYSHSGSLAVRAAVSAGVNITYKILYNDAVAMTGGQKVESGLGVAQIARQVADEGVARVVIVADDPARHASAALPRGCEVRPRADLDAVQRELREMAGVTILIFDQVCATEKRRRIKRGQLKAPTQRAYINPAVCEGCGDCSAKSSCLSIEPLQTEFGVKRQVNQSTCNQDLSCLKGFCPSFVTVEGGDRPGDDERPVPVFDTSALPSPAWSPLQDGRPVSIVFTGVGGAGVTTVSAILAMAAHADGVVSQTLDMTGLAQKGGPVVSHVRLSRTPEDAPGGRTPAGCADLVIACDLVVAASGEMLCLLDPSRTQVLANADITPTKEFVADRNAKFDERLLAARVRTRAGGFSMLHAEGLAERLLGDAIYTNMIMLGFAWQAGRVPVTREAIHSAIALNGVRVEQNTAAFELGRLAFAQPDDVGATQAKRPQVAEASLQELVDRRAAFLVAYQDETYARRYRDTVETVRQAEAELGLGDQLARTAATSLFRMMAIKDEYEVARLYVAPEYRAGLEATFGKGARLTFHLSPPLLAPRDSQGAPRKIAMGGWVMPVFHLLARMKGLRGSRLDLFGWTGERRMERRLRDDFVERLRLLARDLTPARHSLAIDIARLPEDIRGFGHVKAEAVEKAERRLEALMRQWHAPSPESRAPEPRTPVLAAE